MDVTIIRNIRQRALANSRTARESDNKKLLKRNLQQARTAHRLIMFWLIYGYTKL